MHVTFWSNTLAFLSGGMVGTVITHVVTGYRERQARISDFRGFVGGWLGSTKVVRDVTALHPENVKHLWGYYGRTYRDFKSQKREMLKALCDKVTAVRTEGLEDYRDYEEYRDSIVGKLNELIDHIR
jgi:hypothetical protein